MRLMKPTESPPQLFLRFFRWYRDPKVLETEINWDKKALGK